MFVLSDDKSIILYFQYSNFQYSNCAFTSNVFSFWCQNYPNQANFLVFCCESYDKEARRGMKHEEKRKVREDNKELENRDTPSDVIHHPNVIAVCRGTTM